jgi:hypothetical protein
MVSENPSEVIVPLIYSRECSGIDGTALDIMVISGGDGDWDLFSVEEEAACITVHCRLNSTYPYHALQNVTCP